jgi:hypothetical protein
MASDNALTYEGALRLLGKHDQKWIKRLDTLLGGVILGAGVVALLGNPMAAPVVVFTALWGWVDQKNEAIRLVSQAMTALPGKRREVRFSERVEQMTAAHTVLVVSAYFEALREALGDDYELLELSEVDKANAAVGGLAQLYTGNVPKPGAQRGFSENLEVVSTWQERLHHRVVRSFGHLFGPTNPHLTARLETVPQKALHRYESHYLALAAEIPEFAAWAAVTEHAATRSQVRALRDDLLAGPDGALSRLERALSAFIDSDGTRLTDLRESVARANRSVLNDPILPQSTGARYGNHLSFPTIGQAFITPGYRFAVSDGDSRPADDTWWSEQEPHGDLHIRLMAYLASAEATAGPLLLLGHPGAGKSLLTKVLASRLPASGYTVVRVSLRRVNGHSSVRTQVQQALDQVTGGRVTWPDLVDQSADTVRVVILDGLDELLQQTHTRLYGYLDAVAEFQRREADQGHPVAVVVTTRTLACDRVAIADGTIMIKLENFDDGRIQSWLNSWHSANAAGIAVGTVREFPLETALDQRKLTSQPLLLMMMALYVANPGITMLDEWLSSAELYRRLLEHFAEREAEKSSIMLRPQEIQMAVEDHLTRLSTAALGMFNRGVQDITGRQLEQDLQAFTDDRATIDTGERVLGEFFFVYAPESRVSADTDQHYEFLHATFGEYLVASRVVDELNGVARAAFSSRRGGMRTPEDDLLFALLSHQSLALLRPSLTFVTELAAELPSTEVKQMLEVLDSLLERHRVRPPSERFRNYLPGDTDQIARLAAYSANLLLIRLALSPDQKHSITRIFPTLAAEPFGPWRSLLTLWQTGLSPGAWRVTISFLARIDDQIELLKSPVYALHPASQQARLSHDRELERMHRFGLAFASSTFWAGRGDRWLDVVEPWLAHGAAYGRPDGLHTMLPTNVSEVAPRVLIDALVRIEMLLKLRAQDTHIEQAKSLVVFLLDHADLHQPCGFALASTVLAHPDILEQVPRLSDPRWFMDDGVTLLMRADRFDKRNDGGLVETLLDSVMQQRGTAPEEPIDIVEVVQLWRAHMWPKIPWPLQPLHTMITEH